MFGPTEGTVESRMVRVAGHVDFRYRFPPRRKRHAEAIPRQANIGGQWMPISEHLRAAEAQLELLSSGSAPSSGEVRAALVAALSDLCGGGPEVQASNLADLIEAAGKDPKCRRPAALFLIRCLGVPGAIPGENKDDGKYIQRKLVGLVEQGVPDICNYLKLADHKQTIDKIDVLRDFHRQCAEVLEIFRTLSSKPDEFSSRRQDIFRVLNHKILKSYLNNYQFDELSTLTRSIVNGVVELQETSDATFGPK